MNNEERTVEECRIQKVEDKMATIKTGKKSQGNFDKTFYVNNIKNYPLDKILYLFEKDSINKTNAASMEQLVDLEQLIDNELIIDNIKELTINDDRKPVLAAITLYNVL